MLPIRTSLIIGIALKLRENWRKEVEPLPAPLRYAGFTLIELSIVLVIIGMIVGGVLVGQDLVKAAQIRSVITQKQAFEVAGNTFTLKYQCIAGDCNKAETFFGEAHATPTTCELTASIGSKTCNGDGDKNIEARVVGSRETYRFWQQLAAAELIEGQYTGIPYGGASYEWWRSKPRINSPLGINEVSGWSILARSDVSAIGGWYNNIFQPPTRNWLQIGTQPPNGFSYDPLFTGNEALSIDKKIDDGMPGTGHVTTFKNAGQATCASSDTASTATYQLASNEPACALFFSFMN